MLHDMEGMCFKQKTVKDSSGIELKGNMIVSPKPMFIPLEHCHWFCWIRWTFV